MKNQRKYIFKILQIVIIAIAVLCITVVTYVTVNKDSIIAQVKSEMEKKLNGNLSIGSVELSFIRNFPAISVLLHNVSLTDTLFARHHHVFFKGKEVFVNLAVTRLIRKKPPVTGFRIDHAEFYLFTDTSGYTNTYLLHGKKDSSKASASESGSELKKIVLNDVRIIIQDLSKAKYHNLLVRNMKVDLDDAAKTAHFYTKANILINSLAFNTGRGSFLTNKSFTGNFEMKLDKESKVLQFDSIWVKISGQPFNLTGRFQLSGPAPQFLLKEHTRRIGYSFLKELMPEKIAGSLSIVELDKPLDADAVITGPLKGGDPVVIATWSAKNTQLKTPFMDFDAASFTGYFTNEVVPGLPRKDPNSKIVVTNLTATWHGLPVVSKQIQILNLMVPEVSCDIASDFPLDKLNDLIGGNSLQFRKGRAAVHLNYKGPIERNNNTNSFLNGDAIFSNGNIVYLPRDVEMKNLNARIVFRNSDVFVENIRTAVLGQNIIMQGEAKNLLTLINTEPDKANIEWNIYSPAFNLEAFTYLLGERKHASVSPGKPKGVAAASARIDNLLEQGRLHVVLKTPALHYKKFDANNVLADITLLQDRYIINNVNMSHAGGTMGMNGSLLSIAGDGHQAKLVVIMQNVDVRRTLMAFDNFGQDGITSQNLEGKLSTKIDASMIIDDNGKIIPASISSIVDFSLKDGSLNNYEPVKKLQKFIFKNRDFDNIRFAELKDRLEIQNREIKINRMEIQSTVMSMFVEGIYSQTGNTDMSIQLPLSNLKKRSADFNPENIGADKKGGGSIYIRGRPGPDGNVKFKLDLFNRFDKQKVKVKK